MSSLADDGGTGLMIIIIFLGSTNGEGYTFQLTISLIAHSVAKLSMLNE